MSISSSSGLNNGGEYIILKDSSGNEVDRTPEFKEDTSSPDTWQYCEDWIFGESTKNKANPCPKETEDIDKEEEETLEEEMEEKEPIRIFVNNSEHIEEKRSLPVTLQTISVESKDIKTKVDKNNSSRYAIYGLIGFLILIITLMSIRQRRYTKNEFT